MSVRLLLGRSPWGLRADPLAALVLATVLLIGSLTLPTFHYGSARGETVFHHSHALVVTMAISGAVLLGGAWWDLRRRISSRSTAPGYGPFVLGVLMAAFSVFGWIPGVLTVGVFGTLIALSGRPLHFGPLR